MQSKPVKVFQSELYKTMYVVVFCVRGEYSVSLKNVATDKKTGKHTILGPSYYYRQLDELQQMIYKAQRWIEEQG